MQNSSFRLGSIHTGRERECGGWRPLRKVALASNREGRPGDARKLTPTRGYRDSFRYESSGACFVDIVVVVLENFRELK